MQQPFTILINRYLTGELSAQERNDFLELLASGQYPEELNLFIDQAMQQDLFAVPENDAVKQLIFQRLQDLIVHPTKEIESSRVPIIHRVHFLRRSWFKYAAAVLIVLSATAYLWNNNQSPERTASAEAPGAKVDIAPGGNKAVLTLADGSTIVLDGASNGAIAQQGNAQVIKMANGQIVYNLKGVADREVMMNTMSTPNGGQYQLVLPDGTKVWLNAASSITYPAAFIGAKRNVVVTGEVYFEVAINKAKPFLVDVDGKSIVEVLGTHFNVNSYKGENAIKTTLVQGSVRVVSSDQQSKSSGINDNRASSATLKPGQQSSIIDGQLSVSSHADLEQTLAWKNGLFNFNHADLPTVMRQLERWYDVKVKYEGSFPAFKFQGEMDRGLHLSDVLEALTKMGAKLRLDGKTLIVGG